MLGALVLDEFADGYFKIVVLVAWHALLEMFFQKMFFFLRSSLSIEDGLKHLKTLSRVITILLHSALVGGIHINKFRRFCNPFF